MQIAILNFSTLEVDVVCVPEETAEKISTDILPIEDYLYDELGYSPCDCQFMCSDNEIKINKIKQPWQ